MVSLTEQHAAILGAESDPELSGYLEFLNGATNIQWSKTIPHVGLISAACGSNERMFRRELAQLENRQISSGSEWVRNNTLIFFLLLGCKKWKIETILFERILNLESGGNRYETEMRLALRSIHRGHKGYDGEYGFVKLGHDLLLDSNVVLDEDLIVVFDQLYSKEVFELEEGFFGLLANWVFRKIVIRLKPANEISIEKAVACLVNNQTTISLGLAWRLMKSLSVGVIMSLVGILVTIFLAGYGVRELVNEVVSIQNASQQDPLNPSQPNIKQSPGNEAKSPNPKDPPE